MLKNKKGSLADMAYIIVAVVFFAVGVLLVFSFTSQFNDRVQDLTGDTTTEAKAASQSMTEMYNTSIDNSVLFLLIALCVASIILAMLISVHPVFLIIYLIMLGFIVFFAGIGSNIYQTAAQNPQLAPYASQLIFTSHILTYLPIIIAIFGSILAIIIYRYRQQ